MAKAITQAFSQFIPHIIGLGIAKPAVQLAAKTSQLYDMVGCSSALLPVADGSMDIVSSLFSLFLAEMARVLKHKVMYWLFVPQIPIYGQYMKPLFGDLRAHQPDKFLEELASHFELVQQHELRFDLHLPQQA
ncbi:MAG: hypothetical protein IPG70_12435 [Moraxellaceae bacterium]|nr:hypothetical protein [Moraxellaceae bacterium]